MSQQVVHDMNTAWTSSNPAALAVTLDPDSFIAGPASNRLDSPAGSLGVFIEFPPLVPLDLGAFDELRFWIRSDVPADGSRAVPFYLEFSYVDAGDLPGEEHRWFVPVNGSLSWEQRRIGIESDRRTAITRFRFTCLTGTRFACRLDDLRAVHEEMLPDLEATLVGLLEAQLDLPGVTNVPLAVTGTLGDPQVVLPPTPGFAIGNRIRVQGGAPPDPPHAVAAVAGGPNTTLTFPAGDTLQNTFPLPAGNVTVLVPVLVEAPPTPMVSPTPAVVLTLLDAREDLDRTGYGIQRDSFRPRGSRTVCSTRPAARAYVVDYQVTTVAPERSQQRFVQDRLLERLSIDRPVWINGAPAPVWILAPPALLERQLGELAPIYVRIGTRRETAPRRERPFVTRAEVGAGRIDAPLDREGIVLDL